MSTLQAAAQVARAKKTARVAVIGAAGYSGGEFARLALEHPGVLLEALVVRSKDVEAAQTIETALPGVDPRAVDVPMIEVPELEQRLAEGAVDTVDAALPHGTWKRLLEEHAWLAGAERVIDLSSDHRDGSAGYVYGLPEAFRGDIAQASRIANPGCYPTAAALALLPLAGSIDGPVTVTALSGVSGAGRGPKLKTSFVEVEGNASFYEVGTTHGHVAEMARTLAKPMTPEAAHEAYVGHYAAEPFVNVLDAGVWPETRHVRNSNRCDLSVTTLHDGATLLATAAIDNLVKGAAGQALQNLNLMLGWPEGWGLPVHGSPW